jgi:hypothetical protein
LSATEYKWTVRINNTGRLAVQYAELDGTPIPTTGVVGTLYVYDSGETVLEKLASNDEPNGRFDIFLSKAEILGFDFRQAEYELIAVWPGLNADELTLVEGPLVVASGRGPFE